MLTALDCSVLVVWPQCWQLCALMSSRANINLQTTTFWSVARPRCGAVRVVSTSQAIITQHKSKQASNDRHFVPPHSLPQSEPSAFQRSYLRNIQKKAEEVLATKHDNQHRLSIPHTSEGGQSLAGRRQLPSMHVTQRHGPTGQAFTTRARSGIIAKPPAGGN